MRDLRNLPEAVIERLAERDAHELRRDFVVQRGKLIEARTAKVELRRTESGDPIFDGYATVYEYRFDVAGGPDAYGWAETVARGAFDKTVRERDDVQLLYNHEGIPLARTESRTLNLESDATGVRVETPQGLDMRSPLVQSLSSAMERGDLDEMSMAFRVIRQEWNDDRTERRITEAKLFDVSLVNDPANPAAVAQLRSNQEPTETAGMSLAYAKALADQARRRAS